jgi:pyrroloquinoline quinone (PQQ) biosynthesis protein C
VPVVTDLRVCGANPAQVQAAGPGDDVEVMIAYACDSIHRGNPLAFFGMVHVLEGTSVAVALRAADGIQQALGLPDQAFSYLRSHGLLDQEHTDHFELLMDEVQNPDDQKAIVHGARQFYRLYGNVFKGVVAMTSGEPA